jgi:hypothetical protein
VSIWIAWSRERLQRGAIDLLGARAQTRAPIAVFLLLGVAAPAGASSGIKLTSEAKLHPLVQSGLAYDSNPHRGTGLSQEGDLYLLLQGGFEIAVPSDRLDVRMHNSLSYHHYLGLGTEAEDTQSTSQLSTVKGGTALQLLGNRKGKVRWGAAAKINRLDEPEPLNLGVRQGRWNLRGDTFMEWRPGGRALGLKPAFDLTSDSYDTGTGNEGAAKLDRLSPGLRFDMDWRFLPRTQLMLNNRWNYAYYPNDADANGMADPVSSELGLMGQFTPRLSGIIAGGYAGSQFLLSGESAGAARHTFAGQVEVRYDESKRVTWRLGARRRMLPATMFGYMEDNSAYARYAERYRGGFRVVSQLKGSLRTFGALTATDVVTITGGSSAERADMNANFDISLLWQPKKWWMLGLTNKFELFNTNSQFKSAGVAGDSTIDPSYTRNLSMVVFEAKY